MAKLLIALCAIALAAIAFLALIPVNINEADNGRTIEILRFRTIRLTLASNPSTGYSWQIISPAEGKILRRCYAVYGHSPAKLVGAPGYEEFKFRAMSPGVTEIRMSYLRPWERSQPPARTFALSVRVR